MESFTPIDSDLNFQQVTPVPVSNAIRFANLIIDRIVAVAVIFGFGMLFGNSIDASLLDNTGFGILVEVIFYLIYYFLMEATTQRTIGKYLTGTIVVMEDGSRPTTGAIALRTICRLIPFEPLSFFGTRGWHDSLSKTIVVSTKSTLPG